MMTPRFAIGTDLKAVQSLLRTIGQTGRSISMSSDLLESFTSLDLTTAIDRNNGPVFATSRLFELGPTRHAQQALRRILSIDGVYRNHMLRQLLTAVKEMPDDESIADTLEQLDHLSPELLARVQDHRESDAPGEHIWDLAVWQSPDSVTLLSKVVEQPFDIAPLPTGPVVPVGFDWLDWDTPPANPAPAPWADSEPLKSPLLSVRHPFWGAMIATLDACTGDYEWQSLILRGGRIRSQHRTIGKAEPVVESMWKCELGLYPVPPLVVPDDIPFVPGKPLHWLQRSLDQLAEAGIATESEGSWRLTDHFRTELMKDDEHMIAFEAVRQRSYRLATTAGKITDIQNEVVAR